MHVDATIAVKQPTDEVFDYVTDVANMSRWVTGVSSAQLIDRTMGPGARFVCRYTSALRPNEIELEVTSYEPPTVFGMTMSRGPFSFEGTMTLRPSADGTQVTNSIVVDPDSLATRLASLLFGWFLRPNMRKRLARELDALKASMSDDKLADA